MNKKRRILVVFGTRPEAIKMAPVVEELSRHKDHFEVEVCVTAQHREMLDQVLDFFGIQPRYDLNLMKPGQNLYTITADVITELKAVLDEFRPDYVLVHGDTTTSTAAALAAFYFGAKVCHVEAGLRTYDKRSPFPEEMNRQLTGRLTDLHFAPTERAKENLLKEGVPADHIYVTGNTVIDALIESSARVDGITDKQIEKLTEIYDAKKKLVLVTGHRRENFGQGFINICESIQELSANKDVQIIFPVHLNPNVQKPVFELLDGISNIHLIEPLAYPAFVWLMKRSTVILTDSGGVQEEAPSLGKPVLVMRNTTERPEAVEAGTVKLVGTDKAYIVSEISTLLQDDVKYASMAARRNPYGDGLASKRIAEVLLNHIG